MGESAMMKHLKLAVWIILCIFLYGCKEESGYTSTPISETTQIVTQTLTLTEDQPVNTPTEITLTKTATFTIEPSSTAAQEKPTQTITLPPQPTIDYIYVPHYDWYQFSWMVGYLTRQFPIGVEVISGYSPNTNELSPGCADILSFANFADKITYWVPILEEEEWKGHLMIADMRYTQSKEIYKDQENLYDHVLSSNLRLLWTPDDMHIIIDASYSGLPSMIYHLEEDKLEPWSYICDSVAISPRSGSYATWCISIEGSDDFAVIEWGGTIWYSEDPPQEYLIERNERVESPWAWSADGSQIAYFDDSAVEANLTVVDNDTKQAVVFPVSAYWLSEHYIKDTPDTIYIFRPIKWSENGQSILVYAKGSEQSPCPDFESMFSENPKVEESACWQVIDAHNGDPIWPTKDEPYEAAFYSQELLRISLFIDAVITADGAFAAIEYIDPIAHILLVDLENGRGEEIQVLNTNTMRWGPK